MLQEEDNNIDLGEYGLGDVRTHHDYERYAGIHFKNRKLHPDTLKGVNPPINDDSEWHELIEEEYNYTLNIPSTDDFQFIYIGIEDEKGNVLFRVDLKEYTPQVVANFKSFDKPFKWVYWPVNSKGEWVNRIDTNL
jgi:hypothetical protein